MRPSFSSMYDWCQVERSTKSSWRALDKDGGQGAWRLRADTWLAEMNDAFGGTAVDGRRKEETFQVGWKIWSQLRDGHSAIRFGRATPQDSVLEDF